MVFKLKVSNKNAEFFLLDNWKKVFFLLMKKYKKTTLIVQPYGKVKTQFLNKMNRNEMYSIVLYKIFKRDSCTNKKCFSETHFS